jgi:hypothetical protein
MSGKVLATIVAAMLLASTGLAHGVRLMWRSRMIPMPEPFGRTWCLTVATTCRTPTLGLFGTAWRPTKAKP